MLIPYTHKKDKISYPLPPPPPNKSEFLLILPLSKRLSHRKKEKQTKGACFKSYKVRRNGWEIVEEKKKRKERRKERQIHKRGKEE